jgi:hypothetical protein
VEAASSAVEASTSAAMKTSASVLGESYLRAKRERNQRAQRQ